MRFTLLTFLATFTLLFLSVFALAQENQEELDEIHKFDGDVINAKISEMNTTEIKYYYLDRPTLVLAIDNELVDYIILSTGETIKPENTDDQIADLAYDKQRKMAIKLGLFTPLQGYTDFGFEYSRKPLHSLEGSVGIIGLGTNNGGLFGTESEDRGAVITAGYKVYAQPGFFMRKIRNAHRMTGLYVKPTLGVAYFTSAIEGTAYDYNTGNSIDYTTNNEVTQGALLLQVGRQIVFGDIISLDLNAGLGYGFKTINESSTLPIGYETFSYIDFSRNYGFASFDGEGVAGSVSFKVGILLK